MGIGFDAHLAYLESLEEKYEKAKKIVQMDELRMLKTKLQNATNDVFFPTRDQDVKYLVEKSVSTIDNCLDDVQEAINNLLDEYNFGELND